MSWAALLALIAEEGGDSLAARIEARAKRELGGLRITIGSRKALTRDEVEAIAPGRPREAARRLGVHPETVYRLLRRSPLVR